MKIDLRVDGHQFALRLPPESGRWSFAMVPGGTFVGVLSPILPTTSAWSEIPAPQKEQLGPFALVLRQETAEAVRAVTSRDDFVWHAGRLTIAGSSLERGSVRGVTLEACDPGLLLDLLGHDALDDEESDWLLRTEGGAPNQLAFLKLGAVASFGRAREIAARGEPDWIWRWLPCASEADPTWKRNRTISRRAGRLDCRGADPRLENLSGNPAALILDGEEVAATVSLTHEREPFLLEVSTSRLALEGRFSRRPKRPLVYVNRTIQLPEHPAGWGEHPAVESVSFRRVDGYRHHQYVLIHASATIGSSSAATLNLEGPGIEPIHAQLIRLGAHCYLCAVMPGATVRVDGQRVRPRHMRRLRRGALIELGDATFRFLPADEIELKALGAHTHPGAAPLDDLSVRGLFGIQESVSAFRHSVCNVLLTNLRGLAPMLPERWSDEAFRKRFLNVLDRDIVDQEIGKLMSAPLDHGQTVQSVFPELCRELQRRAHQLARTVSRLKSGTQTGSGLEALSREAVTVSDELIQGVQQIEGALARRRVEVGRLVTRARDIVLADPREGTAEITIRHQSGARDQVFGLESELLNVFVELFRNADRHGASHGAIDASVEPIEGRRGGVCVVVRSRGPELPARAVARMLDDGSPGRYGLVYVRDVVERLHCGILTLNPAGGGGLEVRVQIFRQVHRS